MSIDVEGAEERVLDGLDFDRYGFGVITIERPSQSIRRKFDRYGYVLVKEIPGLDAFYMNESIVRVYVDNAIKFHSKRKYCVRIPGF